MILFQYIMFSAKGDKEKFVIQKKIYIYKKKKKREKSNFVSFLS